MTQEQFDNYRFGIKTEISVIPGEWEKVTEVNFEDRTVAIERGQIYNFNEVLEFVENKYLDKNNI